MRQLVVGDNLEVMSDLPDGSVDLIYMDPPFASGRDYEIATRRGTGTSRPAPDFAFSDKWSGSKPSKHPTPSTEHSSASDLATLISLSGTNEGLRTYLSYIGPRLIMACRLLKETGSLYLHCDPTAVHYLKILLDSILGGSHFQSEIIWKRTHAHSSTHGYGPIHDVILFYTKSENFTWNAQYTPYSDEYKDKYFRKQDERGRYQSITCTGPGDRTGTRAHYQWRGVWPPVGRHWAWTKERMQELEQQNRIEYSRNNIPRLKRYIDDGPGVQVQDIWTDINRLDAHSNERIGYETQKPVSLMSRIISASSSPGDLILDPFMGSGTTMVAAERLSRNWIGIDTSVRAGGLALGRITQEVDGKSIDLKGFPTNRQQAIALRDVDPLAFGFWASGNMGTLPLNNELTSGVLLGLGMSPSAGTTKNIVSVVPCKRSFLTKRSQLETISHAQTTLVLKVDRSVQSLMKTLKSSLDTSTFHELTLQDLFSATPLDQLVARQ